MWENNILQNKVGRWYVHILFQGRYMNLTVDLTPNRIYQINYCPKFNYLQWVHFILIGFLRDFTVTVLNELLFQILIFYRTIYLTHLKPALLILILYYLFMHHMLRSLIVPSINRHAINSKFPAFCWHSYTIITVITDVIMYLFV